MLLPMVLLVAFSGFASVARGSSAVLEFINKARTGLQPLKPHPLLEETARNHSRYMAANNERGHIEKEGYPGFTGANCGERLVFSGYPARVYIENLSSGQPSWENSVQELMSAIYHRLGFLSFYLDEVGLAQSVSVSALNSKPFYSYVMGYSGYRELCGIGITGAVTGICSDANITVDERELYRIRDKPALESADYVMYPWNDQDDVAPCFMNNELPTPFTDITKTGQPVSIHFNPARFCGKTVVIIRFILKDEQENEVTLLPRMDKGSDANHLFSAFDFAWFPEQPLNGNTRYHAHLSVMIDGYPLSVSWSFCTALAIHLKPDY